MQLDNHDYGFDRLQLTPGNLAALLQKDPNIPDPAHRPPMSNVLTDPRIDTLIFEYGIEGFPEGDHCLIENIPGKPICVIRMPSNGDRLINLLNLNPEAVPFPESGDHVEVLLRPKHQLALAHFHYTSSDRVIEDTITLILSPETFMSALSQKEITVKIPEQSSEATPGRDRLDSDGTLLDPGVRFVVPRQQYPLLRLIYSFIDQPASEQEKRCACPIGPAKFNEADNIYDITVREIFIRRYINA